MYYPYLRGKQFELKALREIATEDQGNKYLCPIIEPVRSNFNTLNIAIRDIKNGGMKFALILNPNNGDFSNIEADVYNQTKENLAGADWIPTLIYQRNCKVLNKIIEEQQLQDYFIVFKDGVDFEKDEELEAFLNSKTISTVVISKADSRAAKSKLKKLGKNIIRLDDNFNEQKRNVDYIGIAEEQFSEHPFYYEDEGFFGFSDYTTLSKNFVEGGMLPYAITIHLTYKPSQEMIYIHHFVSDSNLDQSNIQGKFAEAGNKAIEFFNENTDYFQSTAIAELQTCINEGKYPGLGVLKKISIKHHLQLISNILENQ